MSGLTGRKQQLAPEQETQVYWVNIEVLGKDPNMGNGMSQELPVQATLVNGHHAVKASEVFPAQTQASVGLPEHSKDGRQKPLKKDGVGGLSLPLSSSPKVSAPSTGLSLPVDEVPLLNPPPYWNNGHPEEPTFSSPRWQPPPCVPPSYLLDEEKQSFDWDLAWLWGPGPPGRPASSSKAQSSAAESSGKVSERKTCSFGALGPAELGGEPGRQLSR
ncbi:hypothetical protein H920_08489 [Fukomys damarensis]|uniref:Uncharacterized protein n=1 Tax=Fukomys damarensis TaxID=885580 RepID=A0A091DGE9_FUKDA|nr:hypothetical protein H920_08489 [Fukomys damarensis]